MPLISRMGGVCDPCRTNLLWSASEIDKRLVGAGKGRFGRCPVAMVMGDSDNFAK